MRMPLLIVMTLGALFVGVLTFGSPVRTVEEASGVLLEVRSSGIGWGPSVRSGRAPTTVSVQLDDGERVAVSIVAAAQAHAGDRVVLRVREREWPPRTRHYEFVRLAE